MQGKITVPTLLLDRSKCMDNIARMAEKAKRNNLIFRPHFKTHQSSGVGRWFREAGVEKITVSSLRMAEYFANDHWRDITVAFPVNLLEIDLINRLAAYIQLNLLVEGVESVQFLERHLRHRVKLFIKVDVGTHRTGVDIDDHARLERIIGRIANSRYAAFAGFLAHAGHSYMEHSAAGVLAVQDSYLPKLRALGEKFFGDFPDALISIGDTPSCSMLGSFSGAGEIRPGNFVFYDVMQTNIGSCTVRDIAVALACPVVAVHPERQEIVVYGGGVHFSKDRLLRPDGAADYGWMVEWTAQGWQLPEGDVPFLRALSQEHGIVKAGKPWIDTVKPGDILGFLPIHSCMTADLMKSYRTLDGEHIEMMRY
jgi:D-serine deaminase-like pyridoxal phosphate-dependent protein